MDPTKPRPMPAQALVDYRDPADLFGLFSSEAFSMQDRQSVCRELMRVLVERYGNTELVVGRSFTDRRGNTEIVVDPSVKPRSVRYLMRSSLADPLATISAVLEAPDYGGKEQTLPILATIMEPRWLSWWESFQLKEIPNDMQPIECVLGRKQLVWIAAQCARMVLDFTGSLRDVALRSIETTEAWVIGRRSVDDVKAAFDATVDRMPVLSAYGKDRYSVAAANTAATAVYGDTLAPSIFEGILDVVLVLKEYPTDQSSRIRVASMMRSLITPTLVSSAAGGYR